MAELDGYLFVTAEYDRSITGVLKNMFDRAYRECNRKPVAFIGYGGVGGARAIEHLRPICVELQIVRFRFGEHIAGDATGALIFEGREFGELEIVHMVQAADVMLDDLAWRATTLKTARPSTAG